MPYFLSDSGDTEVELFPEYDYKDSGEKIEARHRTRDGSEYVYKWGEYREIEFDVKYVSSSFKVTVNSWWAVNESLVFREGVNWRVNSAEYNNQSLDVSGQTIDIAEIMDGDGYFYVYDGSGILYQYSKNGSDNLNDFSYDSKSFDSTSEVVGQPRGGTFKEDDGSKFYLIDQSSAMLYQYSTLTNWEVDSASYDSKSFDLSNECTAPQSIEFNKQGTKFKIIDAAVNSSAVHQYSVLTAWEIDSASYDGESIFVNSEDTSPSGIRRRSNDKEFYFNGQNTNKIYNYIMPIADAVNSATYSGEFLDFSNELTDDITLEVSSDGSKLYVGGGGTVYQYDMPTTFEDVRIINKTKPVDQFERPYNDLFKGTIELGTF